MTDNGRLMTTLPLDVQCTHRVPSRLESRRRMQTVLAITAGVMIAEAIGGWLAHSLALLADAGHMLADVAAIGLSLAVAYLAQRPATAERTFGLLRLEILAALVNGAVLIVISLGIALEAYHRFRTPPAVHGALLVIVAAIGPNPNAAAPVATPAAAIGAASGPTLGALRPGDVRSPAQPSSAIAIPTAPSTTSS